MQHQLLTYRDSAVSYYRFGHGPKQVCCFHGYGESAQSFAFLEGSIGNEYTFHAIDLPFHGQTVWKQGLDFTVSDLQQIISLLPEAANSKPVLFGFSLGGRIALSLYQSQPQNISKLVLLATSA